MAGAALYIVYALNSAMCTAVCAGVACGDTSYIKDRIAATMRSYTIVGYIAWLSGGAGECDDACYASIATMCCL